MTTRTRKNDKRDRLVEAASELFFEQGINVTTLANIAQRADVPLGNVYYYFKSKEAIVAAVIEKLRQDINDMLVTLEKSADPKSKLRSFVTQGFAFSERICRFGDQVGSLCQELGRGESEDLSNQSAKLLQEMITWCEKQYQLLGRSNPELLAKSLVASLQGMHLLTLSFKDAAYLEQQTRFIIQSHELA